MICSECDHLKVVREKGFRVTKCELHKGITWDREARVFESASYCRGE